MQAAIRYFAAAAACALVFALILGVSELGAERRTAFAQVDRDGDSVIDSEDACPDSAGLAHDGCPPRDSDADGLLDAQDRCPTQPGLAVQGGCPDTDGDGDGVADRVDQCASVAGAPRFWGCPAPDRDRDAIADPDDQCPTKAEVWNGKRDTDGCPDRGERDEPLVELALGSQPAVLTLAKGRLFRSAGVLSSRGRDAVSTALAVVRRARVRAVRVVVTAGRPYAIYGKTAEEARTRAEAVAAHMRSVLEDGEGGERGGGREGGEGGEGGGAADQEAGGMRIAAEGKDQGSYGRIELVIE